MSTLRFFRQARPLALVSALVFLTPSADARNDRRQPVSPPKIEVSPTPGFESAARQHQIRTAIDRGDLAEARKLLSLDLKRAPKDPENQFLLGRIEVLEGRRKEGMQLFEKASKLQPDNPVYRRALATLLEEDARSAMSQRRYEDAVAAWKSCLALKHKPRESERLLNETYRAWASHHLASGRPPEAERILREGLQQLPDQPTLRLDLANLLLSADRLDEARRVLKELVEANPTFADGMVSLARVLHRSGESRDALKYVDRALGLAPRHEAAQALRKDIVRESPTLNTATPATSEGFAADEPDPEVVQRLAQFESSGNLQAQVQILGEHLAANPNASWAQLRLAMVRERQGKPEEALSIVTRYLEDRPDDVRAQFLRARCLHLSGDLAGSYQALKALEAEGKGTLQVQDEIGQVLAKQGKFDEAQRVWNRILAKDPTYAGALFHLGQLAMEKGDQARAQGLFEQALKQEPYNLKFRFFAGLNLKQSGKPDEAKALWGAARAFLNLQDPYGVRLARALGEPIPTESAEPATTPETPTSVAPGTMIVREEPVSSTAASPAVSLTQPGTTAATSSGGSASVDLYKASLEAARAGRYEQAIAGFRQILAQKPDDFNAVVNLGNAYLASGQPAEAAAQYLLGTKLNPDNTYVLKAAAKTLDDLGLKGRASELAARLAEIKPEATEGLPTAGADGQRPRSNARSFEPVINALLTTGQNTEAQRLAAMATEENPESADLWLLAGDAARQAGKLVQAESAYRKSAELDRQNLLPVIKLGELYAVSGKATLAQEQFAAVLASRLEDPRALLFFGEVCQRLNDQPRLREVISKLQGMNLSEAQLEQLRQLQNTR